MKSNLSKTERFLSGTTTIDEATWYFLSINNRPAKEQRGNNINVILYKKTFVINVFLFCNLILETNQLHARDKQQ